MNTAPPARTRTERGCHILELLTVRQPRTTLDLARAIGISPTAVGSSLTHMENQCLIRRAVRGRGRGAPNSGPPTEWALRCWKGSVQ